MVNYYSAEMAKMVGELAEIDIHCNDISLHNGKGSGEVTL